MGNYNDDAADANEGGADNQSMESGVGFVELDESDDENWVGIHETSQNNEQGSAMDGSFTRDGDDENVSGDKSIGVVEDRAARVVYGNGNGNDGLSPGDDLESLAEELVNDLSFDISGVDSKSVAEGKSPPLAADETSPGGSDTTHGRQNRSCKINDGSNVPSSSKKRKGRRSKKKRNNREVAATTANNENARSSLGVTNATRSGNMRSEAEERLKAEKVMRGDFSPTFEVFTDLDEPDEPDPVV